MALDTTSFRSAIAQLARGLERAEVAAGDELLRDGVIQRFEYTYELSHKFLRRFLEETEPAPEQLKEMSFPALIRLGSERGLLLNGWNVWSRHPKGAGHHEPCLRQQQSGRGLRHDTGLPGGCTSTARRHRPAARHAV